MGVGYRDLLSMTHDEVSDLLASVREPTPDIGANEVSI